jgi:hypothetical protein
LPFWVAAVGLAGGDDGAGGVGDWVGCWVGCWVGDGARLGVRVGVGVGVVGVGDGVVVSSGASV